MRPESKSLTLLATTRLQGKMVEYSVSGQLEITDENDPARLLRLTVAILGDLAAGILGGAAAESLEALGEPIRFAARYFDAYAASKLAGALETHVLLLASAAYYLCDLPGSAGVLVANLTPHELNIDGGGLECLLCVLLRKELSAVSALGTRDVYAAHVSSLLGSMSKFYETGGPTDEVHLSVQRLRRTAYSIGTAREVLLADACCAIATRRLQNSMRDRLPLFSGLSNQLWEETFRKASFPQECWPSQKLLGQRGVFAGKSAIVQLPTSAGKTRAIEIAIRSAFLANRAALVFVVAPFRALCREILESFTTAFYQEGVNVSELSDVFEIDFDVGWLFQRPTILVMTPEKLAYVLRHSPELAKHIGLLVFDEAHQFNSGARGVTFELLIASIMSLVPAGTQTLLISAVIENASAIATWLNTGPEAVVSDSTVPSTDRSIAFASWKEHSGRLKFVLQDNPDQVEFTVPKVIEPLRLGRRGRETKERFFPEKGDTKAIALFLGYRLVGKGAVAVFCGQKRTVAGICTLAVDIFARKPELSQPLVTSDAFEVSRIAYMYGQNLGGDAIYTCAARLGIFSHHGNTPYGIRLAVEHAMRAGQGRLVVCTSTLAQGVNLPIKYLIVASTHQGRDAIRPHEFRNLMGRAGRSGIHTEGTVIFADTSLYDDRDSSRGTWSNVKNLLGSHTPEPRISSLLSILEPLKSENGLSVLDIPPLSIVVRYVQDRSGLARWVDEVVADSSDASPPNYSLRQQLLERHNVLAAIESFILAQFARSGSEYSVLVSESRLLAEQTLAYFTASSPQRASLVLVFELLARNILHRVRVPE